MIIAQVIEPFLTQKNDVEFGAANVIKFKLPQLSCLCLKLCPVYLSKHNVSKIVFFLRLQVRPTQLCPIDRASPYL
jgi:hypothetical protein